VILNKADIYSDAAGRVVEVQTHCPAVPIYLTSARDQIGLEAIRKLIGPGVTAAFVGSSGVGKSTLINALLGEERMATGEVRARDGRGCHITTHRQLILLPDGGLLLDTPGMRELQLLDDEGIQTVFSDIDEMAAQCRFRDCRHDSEPGCAVKQAVALGQIPAERLEHYLKLEREAHSFELRHNEHLRRKSERVWGTLYDEAKRIRRWKRSE
jgi:ribosome biogenesis GTPase